MRRCNCLEKKRRDPLRGDWGSISLNVRSPLELHAFWSETICLPIEGVSAPTHTAQHARIPPPLAPFRPVPSVHPEILPDHSIGVRSAKCVVHNTQLSIPDIAAEHS